MARVSPNVVYLGDDIVHRASGRLIGQVVALIPRGIMVRHPEDDLSRVIGWHRLPGYDRPCRSAAKITPDHSANVDR